MDYINIISKEEIMKVNMLPALIIGIIAIIGLICTYIYMFKTNNYETCIKLIVSFGGIGILFMLLVAIICGIFLQYPSGRYKYQATIDKDKITISEYEDFIEEYNPTIIDGIYY